MLCVCERCAQTLWSIFEVKDLNRGPRHILSNLFVMLTNYISAITNTFMITTRGQQSIWVEITFV